MVSGILDVGSFIAMSSSSQQTEMFSSVLRSNQRKPVRKSREPLVRDGSWVQIGVRRCIYARTSAVNLLSVEFEARGRSIPPLPGEMFGQMMKTYCGLVDMAT